jgi:hypothetical protein
VVIDEGWLDAKYEAGPKPDQRRLDDPTDFVRIEVTSALAREIPVMPVRVDGATMPPAHQLPHEIADLASRNGVKVRGGRDFHGHVNRLRASSAQPPHRSTILSPSMLTTTEAPRSSPDMSLAANSPEPN